MVGYGEHLRVRLITILGDAKGDVTRDPIDTQPSVVRRGYREASALPANDFHPRIDDGHVRCICFADRTSEPERASRNDDDFFGTVKVVEGG